MDVEKLVDAIKNCVTSISNALFADNVRLIIEYAKLMNRLIRELENIKPQMTTALALYLDINDESNMKEILNDMDTVEQLEKTTDYKTAYYIATNLEPYLDDEDSIVVKLNEMTVYTIKHKLSDLTNKIVPIINRVSYNLSQGDININAIEWRNSTQLGLDYTNEFVDIYERIRSIVYMANFNKIKEQKDEPAAVDFMNTIAEVNKLLLSDGVKNIVKQLKRDGYNIIEYTDPFSNPSVQTDKISVQTDNSYVKTDNSYVKTDNSYVKTDKISVQTDNSYVKTDNSYVKTDKLTLLESVSQFCEYAGTRIIKYNARNSDISQAKFFTILLKYEYFLKKIELDDVNSPDVETCKQMLQVLMNNIRQDVELNRPDRLVYLSAYYPEIIHDHIEQHRIRLFELANIISDHIESGQIDNSILSSIVDKFRQRVIQLLLTKFGVSLSLQSEKVRDSKKVVILHVIQDIFFSPTIRRVMYHLNEVKERDNIIRAIVNGFAESTESIEYPNCVKDKRFIEIEGLILDILYTDNDHIDDNVISKITLVEQLKSSITISYDQIKNGDSVIEIVKLYYFHILSNLYLPDKSIAFMKAEIHKNKPIHYDNVVLKHDNVVYQEPVKESEEFDFSKFKKINELVKQVVDERYELLLTNLLVLLGKFENKFVAISEKMALFPTIIGLHEMRYNSSRKQFDIRITMLYGYVFEYTTNISSESIIICYAKFVKRTTIFEFLMKRYGLYHLQNTVSNDDYTVQFNNNLIELVDNNKKTVTPITDLITLFIRLHDRH